MSTPPTNTGERMATIEARIGGVETRQDSMEERETYISRTVIPGIQEQIVGIKLRLAQVGVILAIVQVVATTLLVWWMNTNLPKKVATGGTGHPTQVVVP